MIVVLYVIGGLVGLGLLVAVLGLSWAWYERRRWERMDIGQRLEEYAKRIEQNTKVGTK